MVGVSPESSDVFLRTSTVVRVSPESSDFFLLGLGAVVSGEWCGCAAAQHAALRPRARVRAAQRRDHYPLESHSALA